MVRETARAWIIRGRGAALAAACAGAAFGLIGCSNSDLAGLKEGLSGSRGEMVEAADFAAKGAAPEQENAAVRRAGPGPASGSGEPVRRADVFSIGGVHAAGPATVANDPALDAAPQLSTRIGSPTPDATAPARGSAATVDAVVGQINGRPVFVSEILEPLDGKLRAVARDAKDDEEAWQHGALETIGSELHRMIEEELVLSEARASLTPEQKAGLFRFLQRIEGNLVSSQRGSEVAADEQFREQNGRGLRQEAENIKDKALIENELANKVRPRVVVPWRDVKNEYERRVDKYNPPAKYTFRMVYTDASNSSALSQIQEALNAGKSFVELAKMSANDFNRLEGGVMTRECADAQSDCTFSPVPEINAALQSLGVGQTLGPILYAPSKDRPDEERVAWVYLEKIDRPKGETLYEAQLGIEAELKIERSNAEYKRYEKQLFSRGNVSNEEGMLEKLFTIATSRYAPRFAKR
ncbi:MAG TPA: peptidylprolyl isomerase [Phycisphaerales bacterium]|nr:peptidylprolyl isomerase [Phycisphaerales bacterium]